MLFSLLVNSYNKLEEDFQTANDPLRSYNDYLEEVETISMNMMLIDTWLFPFWMACIIFVIREKYQHWSFLR